jgi:precorrin-4/cobalt-precorrin-4 C11-methyltransferase
VSEPTPSTGLVSFVGAGPGAPDLLTLRAARVLSEADIVIWARSLVDEAILSHCRPDAELIASDDRTLEDVIALYVRAATNGLRVARVASGDPTLYGALNEQLDACRRLGLEIEIVPGVSSVAGAAAALGQELTVPDVSQTLILTRRATRTSMPDNEQLAQLAAHGTTMALFLSVRRPRELQAELLEGGYTADTPCAVVYRATWPDEIVLRCRLDELGDAIRGAKITTQALVLIGPALDAGAQAGRSHVYDPGYGHRFRPLGAPAKYRTKRKAQANASAAGTAAAAPEDSRGAG